MKGAKNMRGRRFLFAFLGAVALAYVGRMMNDERNEEKQMMQRGNGVLDMLARTGRSVADETMKLVRR